MNKMLELNCINDIRIENIDTLKPSLEIEFAYYFGKDNIMTNWNTDEIVSLLTDTKWDITVGTPSGDFDTTRLLVQAIDRKVEHEALFIYGFKCDEPFSKSENKDDCAIDYIAVEDGQSSDGGLNSSDKATCLMYGEIVWRLRNAGFIVINTMNMYF